MPEDGIRGIMARMNESCEGYSGLIRFTHHFHRGIDQLLSSHSISRLWHGIMIIYYLNYVYVVFDSAYITNTGMANFMSDQ